MERGQASLEYLGVVALVGGVLALAGVVVAAPDLTGAVGGQIRRALCIVAGGDCLGPGGPRPCVTSAREQRRDVRADVLVLRLADGRTVLREERSDGSVRVTVVQSDAVGAGLLFGGAVEIAGRGAQAGAELEAGGRGAYGRVFVRPDGPAADRLITALAERDVPFGGAAVELARVARGAPEPGPAPDERVYEIGATGGGSASLRAVGLGAHADALGTVAAGLRLHARTGERTLVLRRDAELTARLTAPLAGLTMGLPVDTTLSVTFDRAGRPVRLGAVQRAAVRGGARLGPYSSRGGDRVEAEVRLELDSPAARADAAAALRGHPLAAARTARRLAEAGRVDVRLYATRREEGRRGAGVGLGARVGGEVVRSTEHARLVAAAAREPGQGWARNLDCELAA